MQFFKLGMTQSVSPSSWEQLRVSICSCLAGWVTFRQGLIPIKEAKKGETLVHFKSAQLLKCVFENGSKDLTMGFENSMPYIANHS